MLTADEVLDIRFSSAGMFRSGYAVSEVDDWLDRVVSTLQAYQGEAEGSVELLAEDAQEVRFRVTRGSGSYDMDQVDAAIDSITAALDAHERAA